jgi:thiol-disulfide isomerase/thioredoxin
MKMSKRNVALFVLLISSISVAFQLMNHKSSVPVSKGYHLQVIAKGVNPQDTVYLCRYFATKQYYQDTAIVDNKGIAHFKDTTQLKEGMYFFMFSKQRIVDFIMNPSTFTLTVDPDHAVETAAFKGSPDNQDFYNYQRYFVSQRVIADSINALYKKETDVKKKEVYLQSLKALDSSMVQYITNFMQAHPTNLFTAVLKTTKEVDMPEIPKASNGRPDSIFQFNYYKKHYFENVNFADDRLIRTPVLAKKVEDYFKNLVPPVADSINKEIDDILKKSGKEIFEYFTREFTYKYETSTLMGMDAVFVHMVRTYYDKGKCTWANKEVLTKLNDRANILEPLLLGKIAPELYMKDTSSQYRYLSSVKANYTILYFWDSQCGHCQKETPVLYEWWKKSRSKGVAVYAANIEREDAAWMKYIREKKITEWYNVRDKGNHTDFKKTYDIYATPVLYVLDKNKKIIAKRIAVEDLDGFIAQYEKNHK